jgi:DNA helicase II / ATP-dependent DNA helicase PcrA
VTSTADDLLRGLDPQQQAAVSTESSPLCIIAGAGSGKTTVLTRRIARRVADGSADPAHVLALTFTRQAAGELVRRLGSLGVRDRPTVGTFHGVAYSVLRQRWEDQGRRAPTLLTQRAAVVRSLQGPGSQPSFIAEVTGEIDWARARRITPERYGGAASMAGRRTNASSEQITSLFAAYEAAKTKRGLIDFDDLLEHCVRALERERPFAAAQQWRFRHLFVDEFQDINPLQMKLLELWRGARPDLCIVGDPNQAIYGWNGSDPSYLRDAAKLFPGLTVVRLTANYRSTPQIIEAGRHILGKNAAEVDTVRPDGTIPQVHAFASDLDEAKGIAELVRESRRPGQPWSSCAVLTRTNSQLTVIEQALTAAHIPVRARSLAAASAHPAVRSALTDATEFTGRTAVRDWVAEVQARLQDPDVTLEALERLALDRLVNGVYEHLESEPNPTLTTLRTALAGEQPHGDGVDLLSFHAAKGREWSTVVIAGLESGLVPHASATTAETKAEEVRLLYVALSRATQTVHTTWSRTRTGYRAGRKRSPLLDGMPTAEPIALPPAARMRPALRPATDHLMAALLSWRSGRARAAGTTPTTVMTDAVLQDLASARPSTAEELLAVAGMSAMAASRFGPQLLALCHAAASADYQDGSRSITTGA